MIFDEKQTQIAKGIAIMLMVWHHLFSYPVRIEHVTYIPFFPPNVLRMELLIGMFGKICVSIFLFLSGYGMYQSMSHRGKGSIKYSLSKMFQFMTQYWICFLVFVPIGLFFYSHNVRYAWDARTFLFSLLGLDNHYNGEWWFVLLYLKLLLLFPVAYWIVQKNVLLSLVIVLIGIGFGVEDWVNIPLLGNLVFFNPRLS